MNLLKTSDSIKCAPWLLRRPHTPSDSVFLKPEGHTLGLSLHELPQGCDLAKGDFSAAESGLTSGPSFDGFISAIEPGLTEEPSLL